MSTTKTAKEILQRAIAIAMIISPALGSRSQTQAPSDSFSGLSPIMMDQLYIIDRDGTVHIDGKIEETNATSEIIRTDMINDLSDPSFTFRDQLGQPMKSEIRPKGGILVTLNSPVQPGQKASYGLKGNLGKLSPNESGEWRLDTKQRQGNDNAMHLVEVWRLPAGAILLTNSPELELSTSKSNRIELRLDKVVPPGGETPLVLGYRLSNATN